jgi:hypothetical protein
LDSSAFKKVFGSGCGAPDNKCERQRYKKLLADAIRTSGVTPSFGGIEYSDDLVMAMNLGKVGGADKSLGRFLDELQSVFQQWREQK